MGDNIQNVSIPGANPAAVASALAKPAWRRMLKRITPLARAYRYWVGVWADLRLWVLTMTGYVPFHCIRNFVYRRFGVRLAKSSSLHWRTRFFNPEGLSIGGHCTLGNDGFYDARAGIAIGDCVDIAAEVRIYTREHVIDDPNFADIGSPVVIEDYAYIGTRVTILPGVRVGCGAVIPWLRTTFLPTCSWAVFRQRSSASVRTI